MLKVVVPTNRPDVRPAPFGIDDVIEEVARTFGYSNVPRHTPTWPQPGQLTPLQRSRRFLKSVCNGLGSSEGWTNTFVSEELHARAGFTGPAVRVSNPLDAAQPYLRRSLLPGLLEALAYNADRRQSSVRLFEVGVVFSHPDEGSPRVVERAGAGGTQTLNLPGEREVLGAVFALDHDDATSAVAAWRVVEDALGIEGVRMRAPEAGAEIPPGLHPTRCARLVASSGALVGAVGEIDPAVAAAFGLTSATGGGTAARRIGWLDGYGRLHGFGPDSPLLTSIWLWWSMTAIRLIWLERHCARPGVIWSSRSLFSMSIGDRGCRPDTGVWPIACASAPSITP